MLEKIDEETLPGGYAIEWAYDPDAESPRKWHDNLGHMYCWGGGFVSPDENPYDDEVDFVRDMLNEHFSHEEMLEAVREGSFGSLRIAGREDGEERLEALYRNYLTGRECWCEVEDYSEWRDGQELAEAIANCPEAVALLSRKMVILTVHRFEHSGVAYSTKPFNDPWDSGAVGFIWADEDDVSSWFEGLRASRDGVARILAGEVEEYSSWANGECYVVTLSKDDAVVERTGGYIGDEGLADGIEEMRRQASCAA